MHITRRQSQIFAVLMLLLFFTVGSLFVWRGARKTSLSQPQATLSPPNPNSQSTAPPELESAPPAEPPPPADVNPVTETQTQDESTFALERFHRSETQGGRTLWEITGSNADYFADSNSVKIRDCELNFSTSDDGLIEVRSREAIVYLKGAKIDRAELSGDVSLLYLNETTITSDTATFLHEENRITSPGKVRIEGEWYTVTGIGLDASLKERSFTLLQNVESRIDPRRKNT